MNSAERRKTKRDDLIEIYDELFTLQIECGTLMQEMKENKPFVFSNLKVYEIAEARKAVQRALDKIAQARAKIKQMDEPLIVEDMGVSNHEEVAKVVKQRSDNPTKENRMIVFHLPRGPL